MPPEKFTSSASDVYGLGLVLKAASFGRRVEDLAMGPAMEADTGAPQFAAWWRILNKATDATPARRYQSAKALLKDVRRLHFQIAVSPVEKVAQVVMRWILILILLFLLSYVVFSMARERLVLAESRAYADAGVAAVHMSMKEIEEATEKRKKDLEEMRRSQEAMKKSLEAAKKEQEARERAAREKK